MHWVLVFLGGGLGSLARHGINRAGLALLGPSFPWWTLTVNVAGSFLIGLLAGLFGSLETGHNARLFLITGFLGFSGVSAATATIAKVLFAIALAIFLIFLILALMAGNLAF